MTQYTENQVRTPQEVEYYTSDPVEYHAPESAPYESFNSAWMEDVVVVGPTIDYKFREDEYLQEIWEYINKTYSQHYSRDKFQAIEFIFDSGHGEGFNVGNVLKYAQRYGKKGTRADARKDMIKVLHYALLQLFLHDEETKRLEALEKAGYTDK